jgi:hypothetical protein
MAENRQLNSVLKCWPASLIFSFDFETIRHTCSEIYVLTTTFFLYVAQERKSGLGRIVVVL